MADVVTVARRLAALSWKKDKKYILGAFAAFLMFGLVMNGILNAVTEQQEAGREELLNARVNAEQVTVDSLLMAYQQNEVAANQRFKDKFVAVAGQVEAISSGAFDNDLLVGISVPYYPGQLTASISSSQRDKVASLARGMLIAVNCTIRGKSLGAVIGEDCLIVDVRQPTP
jgi:hypothetical protein